MPGAFQLTFLLQTRGVSVQAEIVAYPPLQTVDVILGDQIRYDRVDIRRCANQPMS